MIIHYETFQLYIGPYELLFRPIIMLIIFMFIPCIKLINIYHLFFFFVALRPNAVHGLLILDVSRSHTTTHHSRLDSCGQVISSSQRPLTDNTRHSQQTNIHAPRGIRNHDLSRGAAVDPRLRPCGHWDRQYLLLHHQMHI